MVDIQKRLGCSDNKLLALIQCLGSILGQKRLEPGLKAFLPFRNRSLQHLFSRHTIMFTRGKEEIEEEFPVIAADIPALVAFLLEMRNLDPEHHQLHLGLD